MLGLLLLTGVGYAQPSVSEGQTLAFDRSKGNCLTCHEIKGGDAPGNIGPPLIDMKKRFPERSELVAIISDETKRNPLTVMPPFGRNLILTEQEINASSISSTRDNAEQGEEKEKTNEQARRSRPCAAADPQRCRCRRPGRIWPCQRLARDTGRAADASKWPKDAFQQKTEADAIKALYGKTAEESDKVKLDAPEIAENGAVVPITVSSTLPDVTSIAILVPENPFPLAASYKIPAGTQAMVGNRLKMAKTSKVVALVEAGGKLYSATKEVKVTVGGCGG